MKKQYLPRFRCVSASALRDIARDRLELLDFPIAAEAQLEVQRHSARRRLGQRRRQFSFQWTTAGQQPA